MADADSEHKTSDSRQNWSRIHAVLLGLAAGDALGATSEFEIPYNIGRLIKQHPGWPAKLTGGGKMCWPKGAPTDDTHMMMAILRSIESKGGLFDMKDVGEWFVAWLNTGPRDIGTCTYITLGRLKRQKEGEACHSPALQYHKKNPKSAPNGSLMRNGIIPAMFAHESLSLVLEKTLQHSIITHFNPLPVLCCAVHSYFIRNAVRSDVGDLQPPTFDDIDSFINNEWQLWKKETQEPTCQAWLEAIAPEKLKIAERQFLREMEGFELYDPYTQDYRGISGYCILTLKISLWGLHWSYQEGHPKLPKWLPGWIFEQHKFSTIMWVVSIGADADTYAATAGPLLAAYHPEIDDGFLEGLVVREAISVLLGKIKSKACVE